MSHLIQREISLPQPPERVWGAIADRTALAGWMFPNDFEPRVGHAFTFRVPGNPAMNFEGLTVHCKVLECAPPGRLVFSWSAGGPVVDTRVSFRLEPEGGGTRLYFEHSGFDLAHPFGNQAFKGAEFGWARMLGELPAVVADLAVMSTERVLPASPQRVFAAFAQPEQLARWWGPEGFTNTFERFEFWPGGRWDFVMHGPDGADHPNESVFRTIEPDSRIVIEHVVAPWFTLTITLTERDGGTRLEWRQEFDRPEFVAKMRSFLKSANQQNLDRLQAVLADESR